MQYVLIQQVHLLIHKALIGVFHHILCIVVRSWRLLEWTLEALRTTENLGGSVMIEEGGCDGEYSEYSSLFTTKIIWVLVSENRL